MAARRKKTSTRKKTASRKKTTRKKATRKKATRKKATRKKATRKKATRKKATRKKATRKKATLKKASRVRKAARKKTARKKAPARKKAAAKKKAPARRKTVARAKAASDPLKAIARNIVKAGVDPDSVPLERLYAEDCESWESGSNEPAVGIDGLREKNAMWAQMQEGATFKPVNTWTGKDTVSVEWDAAVKLRGGPTVNLREVAVHQIRDGKIQSERYYYDPTSMAPPDAAQSTPPPEVSAPLQTDEPVWSGGDKDSGESGWD